MKKYITSIFLALLVGFFISQYMFSKYEDKETLLPAFSTAKNVYFIQQGVYSTLDSVKENLKPFDNYIYTVINSKYYVFTGITKNQKNVQKMQEFYQQLGYNTYVKEFKVSNEEFLNSLNNYDSVLENTDNNDTIKTLINQVLTKYKELVIDG